MISKWFRRTRRPWTDETLWALDCEATGLDPRKAEILSVGMVPVRAGRIHYGDRWHTLVHVDADHVPPEAALRIHHILPEEARDAPPLPEVLDGVLGRLGDDVLLLHHARLDLGLLKRACKRCERRWPHPRVVDTTHLLSLMSRRRRMLEPHAEAYPGGLADAMAAFDLPEHIAHDALGDAVATAKLFLALQTRLDAKHLITL